METHHGFRPIATDAGAAWDDPVLAGEQVRYGGRWRTVLRVRPLEDGRAELLFADGLLIRVLPSDLTDAA